MNQFKVTPGRVGTGWLGMYVAVDTYYKFDGTGENICLTAEAQNAEEVASYIDELIEQLQELKLTASRKFEGWKGHRLP